MTASSLLVDLTLQLRRQRSRRRGARALQFGAFFALTEAFRFRSDQHPTVEAAVFAAALLGGITLLVGAHHMARGRPAGALLGALILFALAPLPILETLGVSDDAFGEAIAGLGRGNLQPGLDLWTQALGFQEERGTLRDVYASYNFLFLNGHPNDVIALNLALMIVGAILGPAVVIAPLAVALRGATSTLVRPDRNRAPKRAKLDERGRSNRRIAFTFYTLASPLWILSFALCAVALPLVISLPYKLAPQNRLLTLPIDNASGNEQQTLTLPSSSLSLIELQLGFHESGLELFQSAGGDIGVAAFFAFAFGAVSWMAASLTNVGRRFAASAVAEVRAVDDRPPLFLIRSFRDQEVSVRRALRWRDLLSGFALRLKLEEAVVNALWRYGPVLTIGRPGERIRPLGAAREYVAENAWRERVRTYLMDAQALVTILGATPNLAWEYERVVEFGLTSKLLAIVPPVDSDDVAARWKIFASIVEPAHGIALPPLSRKHYLLAIGMRSLTEPLFITARYRNDEAYEAAIETVWAGHAGERILD